MNIAFVLLILESFTFAVRALPEVTTIGAASYGALSRTERVLPNGWIVSLTAGRVEAPNGERYEAIGIPVHLSTPMFTTEDTQANRDSAIDRALSVLH